MGIVMELQTPCRGHVIMDRLGGRPEALWFVRMLVGVGKERISDARRGEVADDKLLLYRTTMVHGTRYR